MANELVTQEGESTVIQIQSNVIVSDGIDVFDDLVLFQTNVTKINFGANLDLVSEGDGTVTVNGTGGGGGGNTNLGVIQSPTDATITSSTGTPATMVVEDGTNVGLVPPGTLTTLSTAIQTAIAGDNITITRVGNEITIASTASGDFDPVITNPQNGQLLLYNSTGDEWENGFITDDIIRPATPYAGRYSVFENQNQFNFIAANLAGGKYFLDNVDSSLYEGEGINTFGPTDHEYTEIGDVNKISTGNENGTFLLEITSGALSLSEGDAVYVSNVAPVDGVEPDDGSDTYTVSEVVNDSQLILNKPILKGASGYPDSDNYKLYLFTYLSSSVLDDDYVVFTGQGQVGYPFQKQVTQPGDIARATKIGQTTIWSFDRQNDRPNYYGVESDRDTFERPENVWSKGNGDSDLISESYPYIFESIRQNFTGIPINRPIVLQNYPVQNVFVVTNQFNYDLLDYPNSYVFKNFPISGFNGSSYDLVVLYGVEGTDPQFDNRPEFMPACHVTMNESGVIQSVQDTFWVYDNGGYEAKLSSFPIIREGLEVVDNGAAGDFQPRRYTLTDSEVTTAYLENVSSTYPEDITVTQIWPDGDDRRIETLQIDRRYYDPTATVPDPGDPNPTHALIPFGFFSVDFLYAYENSGSYFDFLVIKGSTLYNAFDLVQGIDIIPTREAEGNGYLPVAALVQIGGGELGFTNIIDIKGSRPGQLLNITTEEFLEDLSAKTQFRTIGNTVTTIQYSPELEQGEPEPQGWTEQVNSPPNTIQPIIDSVVDGRVSLQFSANDTIRNNVTRDFFRPIIENLYDNGGTFDFKVRPIFGASAGEEGFYVSSLDDPRATSTVFLSPFDNGTTRETYATHVPGANGDIVIEQNGGFIEWVHSYSSTDTSGFIVGDDTGQFGIGFVTALQIAVYINGSEATSGPQWELTGSDIGSTIRIERNGSDVSYYKNNVLQITQNIGSTNSWVVNRIFAEDTNGTITRLSTAMSMTDLTFKQNSTAAEKVYQMKTRAPQFNPDVVDDGEFEIQGYFAGDWKADPSEPGISDTGFRFRFGTSGGTATFNILADAGNQQLSFTDNGEYYDVRIEFNQSELSDWGSCRFTVTDSDGNSQEIPDVDWPYSNFTPGQESWTRFGNSLESGDIPAGASCYVREYEKLIFTESPTVFLTAQDFALNNIVYVEGDRNWTFVVPPVATQVDELNSPDKSQVTLLLRGSGSYIVKRPDLSDDILVDRSDSVQYAYTDFTTGTITCDDDISTLGYVQYRVADYLQGDSAIIIPPPTDAIDVNYNNAGTDITSTNVQGAITELDQRGGAQFFEYSLTVAAGDVYNTAGVTLPTDFATNDGIQVSYNGVRLVKGTALTGTTQVIRENNSAVRILYDSRAGKTTLSILTLPGSLV